VRQPHEEFVQLETTEMSAMMSACAGVHTVVHLAADPRPSADFHTSLLPSNVVGVYLLPATMQYYRIGCRVNQYITLL
jgi:hypothetical protein